MRRKVEIVCHRGANEYAPENTYPAAQICIDWGMDYVEIDVNTSKDGVMYVFHGPQLRKTTNGRGKINQRTSAELDQLDAGSWFSPRFVGERIPRLEPFLRWIKGQTKVFLDVKRAPIKELLALIYDVGLEHDCFFWFGHERSARTFRELAPDLALKMNAEKLADVIVSDEVYRADIIEFDLKKVDQGLIDACRERGMKVMLYHCEKDTHAFKRMLSLAPDMVNVDHGDVFARVAASYD